MGDMSTKTQDLRDARETLDLASEAYGRIAGTVTQAQMETLSGILNTLNLLLTGLGYPYPGAEEIDEG